MTREPRPISHAVLIGACLLSLVFGWWLPRPLRAAPSAISGRSAPAAKPRDRGPSFAIYPPESIPLRFSHQKHLGRGMACTDCHDRARTSTRAADRLVPSGAACDRCHGSDHGGARVQNRTGRADGACSFCHTGHRRDGEVDVVPRVVLPAANLIFNHAVHAARGIDCARCHGAVEKAELATRDHLPRMQGCLECHRGAGAGGSEASATVTGAVSTPSQTASDACSTCHLSEAGRLKTRFPSGYLMPPRWLRNAEHGADWIERHRRVAGEDSRFCSNCHAEKECAGCHDGRVRPRSVHPNDYLSLHPIAARQDGASCTSCHHQQSFCLGCHQRVGVAQSGPLENFVTRGRFHPPRAVWTDGPRSRRHHAWEAQRNLNTCTSCHSERDCATCHATRRVGGDVRSGGGVNPHPPGFRNRCGRPLRQNPRACFFCHGPTDPTLLACR